MSKKTNLAEAMKSVERKPHSTHARAETGSTTREGKKIISGFFPVVVSNQLKLLGINGGKTVQDLLTEAINDLFTKHGKAPIA